MKKRKQAAALLLAMTMALSLCVCGGSGSEVPSTQPPQQSTQQNDPVPTPAPESEEPEEPAGTDSPIEGIPPPANHGEVQTIALQKQLYGLYDWDDADLLVQSEFSNVTVWQNDTAKYPELSQILEQRANMIKRSMEDEYDNFCVSIRETDEDTAPWLSTLDIQVRRADGVAISLLSDSYSDYGWIEDFRGMHGVTYDTQTGLELAVTDVVEIN